jgi:hypothetical protein
VVSQEIIKLSLNASSWIDARKEDMPRFLVRRSQVRLVIDVFVGTVLLEATTTRWLWVRMDNRSWW